VQWATSGGEDYELLLTCDPGDVERLSTDFRRSTGTPLTVIGEIEAGTSGIVWIGADGNPALPPAGFEHFRG
jgi:thiamine monophosphate kinase